MTHERRNLAEFIDLYRRNPVLWDNERGDYLQKDKKIFAYAELAAILRRTVPDATERDVRRKINTLRSIYRRERSKIKQANNSSNTKEVTPTLWWFNKLKFLDHVLERPRKRLTYKDLSLMLAKKRQSSSPSFESQTINLESQSPPLRDSESEAENSSFNKSNSFDVLNLPSNKIPFDQMKNNQQGRQSSRNNNKVNESQTINMESQSPPLKDSESEAENTSFNKSNYFDVLNLPSNKIPLSQMKNNNKINEDEAEIFGHAWSTQFRYLSEDQKIFAKKAIDDILFEAKLGTLHRNSIKINDSLCQHCQTTFLTNEYDEADEDPKFFE